ncbi:methylamine utilization protein MauJ [Corallococcus exercitus]|uniref:Uncharacterized protein n=1 Tax=Corallococcus exercitus TaxID=2316736 RepID=A0A7Y4JQ17_9BACT|nr:methylamine utilization protein MauJ [Corallococcus exercitus]NOK09080.1 hypothetical protein [Corallococcus exercitus]
MSKSSKSRRDRRRQRNLRNHNRQEPEGPATPQQPSGPQTISTSLDLAKLGAPGIQHELFIIAGPSPGVSANREQDMAVLQDSEVREFKIVAHLGKEPGSSAGGLTISLETSGGASHVYAHPDADFMGIETTFGHIQAHLNASKEFSALELRCRANSARQVFARYSDALATLIDHISFHHDVPIFVRYVAIWDEKNKVLTASYVTPYRGIVLASDWLTFDLALSPFYALYREAITNPSVFYQFLCYAKILEGIIRKTFPAIIQEARSRGLDTPRFDARVEDHAEIHGPARNWVGKSVQQTFNDYLQPEFRNAIAHFSDSDEDPLVVSNYITGATISNNLLLARQCARKAISAIEHSIRELKQRLSISPTWMR